MLKGGKKAAKLEIVEANLVRAGKERREEEPNQGCTELEEITGSQRIRRLDRDTSGAKGHVGGGGEGRTERRGGSAPRRAGDGWVQQDRGPGAPAGGRAAGDRAAGSTRRAGRRGSSPPGGRSARPSPPTFSGPGAGAGLRPRAGERGQEKEAASCRARGKEGGVSGVGSPGRRRRPRAAYLSPGSASSTACRAEELAVLLE